METIYTIVGGAVAVFIAVLFWVFSASTIARECKLMGMFYVGDTVYECKVKQ